jgi:rhodanese-related sulfurtransferase
LRMNEIDTKKKIIFICRSWWRSAQACQFAEGFGIHGYNLVGGTNDFEKEFPTQVIRGEKKKVFWIF